MGISLKMENNPDLFVQKAVLISEAYQAEIDKKEGSIKLGAGLTVGSGALSLAIPPALLITLASAGMTLKEYLDKRDLEGERLKIMDELLENAQSRGLELHQPLSNAKFKNEPAPTF